jgi:hypothetical protein
MQVNKQRQGNIGEIYIFDVNKYFNDKNKGCDLYVRKQYICKFILNIINIS